MGNSKTKNQLTSDEINFLEEQSDFTQDEIQEWYDSFRAENPDLKFTKEKIHAFYQEFFGGDPSGYSDRVFDVFDLDKSGYLDFIEFLQCINFLTTKSADEKLKWTFRLYDVDGNGSIDFDEMVQIISYLGDILYSGSCKDMAREKAVLLFEQMDVDEDGRITQEEFTNAIKNDKQMKNILNSPTESLAGNTKHHTFSVNINFFVFFSY